MNKKRNQRIFLGIMILAAALVSGFLLMQPSAEDILVQMIENAKTITDGHAVLAIDVDTNEQKASGTVEVWARRGEDGPGAFRVEVLDASEGKFQGVIIVSDGETLWAYSPSENKVFVGTPEEALAIMEKNEFMNGHEPKEEDRHGGSESSHWHDRKAWTTRVVEAFWLH